MFYPLHCYSVEIFNFMYHWATCLYEPAWLWWLCLCVCVVGWASFHLTDVMAFWNQSSGTLCHAEITSSLLVMEDTRQVIILWDRQRGCLKVTLARLLSFIYISSTWGWGAGSRCMCLQRVCVCVLSLHTYLKHAQSHIHTLPLSHSRGAYTEQKSRGW